MAALQRFNEAMSGVIEYLCASPDHQPPEDAPQPLVIYAGSFAYCPLGADAGHDWRPTGGKTLTTVREWLGRSDARTAERPTAA